MSKVPLILQADSYKYSHFRLFPNGITNNNSYIESRGIDEQSMLPKDAEVVFFGLQILLKEYLTVRVTKQDIARAKALIPAHGEPFNEEDWNIIVDEHDGFLPIVIFALPEGAVIHPGVAMVQVRATDPRFAWLASFVETTILRAVWYPSTVATVSREGKKIIKRFLDKTSDDPSQIMFKLHDFGGRGVSSSESAQIGGVAHLVNFMGTDTVEALVAAQDYYNVEGAAAYSVPASEHSTMTSWGRENEALAIENAIDVFAGDYPIVSIVSDSYDIFNAVRVIYPALKEKIVASGSTVVVRPDSGDPITTPTTVVKLLAESFGTTTNSKGYKVLNNVRVLQGDGINLKSIYEILSVLEKSGFAADNIVFGMGGALLQKVDRDTLKFAQKTNAVEKDGEWIDVYKDPLGSGFKKSKAGVLATYKTDSGIYRTVRKEELDEYEDALVPVFRDGKILVDWTLDEVRARAEVK